MKNPSTLLMMMASIMPKEDLMESLKDSITAYLINPTKEAENKVYMDCQILLSKPIVESEGLQKALQLIDDAAEGKDLLDRIKGGN